MSEANMDKAPVYYGACPRKDAEQRAPREVLAQLVAGSCCLCAAELLMVRECLERIAAAAERVGRPLQVVCPTCLERVSEANPEATEIIFTTFANPDIQAAMARHVAACN